MLLLDYWQKIPGFDRHEASYSGRIRHLGKVIQRGKYVFEWVNGAVINGQNNGNDYLKVGINEYGVFYHEYVHILVAKTFIPNPDRLPEVNHLNLVKWDNRASNLEWCTRKQNIEHAVKNGRFKRKDKKSPIPIESTGANPITNKKSS